MPDIETDSLFQTAVYWAPAGYDDYGEPTIGDPVELSVRWLARQSEGLDPNGVKITLDATVILDQDVAIGGKMWFGALDDLPGADYQPDADVMDVVTFSVTPDIDARAYRRKAGLKLFRATLPGS